MMHYIFPTIYWHFHVGQIDFGDLKDRCIVNDEWNCLIETSRGVTYDWNHFFDKIVPYFNQIPLKKKSHLNFDEPWMNLYTKGCYQESHQHISDGNQLSYCYFSKLPEGSGKFCFWNEQFRNYGSNRLREFLNCDEETIEWFFPDVVEGDLLVFPSFLIHQVTYHGVDEPRITVSGNFKVTQEI